MFAEGFGGEGFDGGFQGLQEAEMHGAQVERLACDVEMGGADQGHELDGVHGVAGGNQG